VSDVVIPTRFERDSLWSLIEAASDVATVVLVHTEPGHADAPGVVNLRDYRRNIGHWWNTGLDVADGPALVLNDDVRTSSAALRALLTALDDADLVYVPGRPAKAPTPVSGWCWGVRPDLLRPDPAYTWWYSDDDLYRRASWPTCVDVDVEHLARGGFGPGEFGQDVKADRALYEERWA
jgi:hypothetical protein